MPWLFLAGVLLLFLGGLTIGLVYLVWKLNDSSLAHSQSSTNTYVPNSNESPASTPTNANTSPGNENKAAQLPDSSPSANANESATPTPTEDPTSLSWLEGVWSGEGYQTDTRTSWTMTLTVNGGEFSIDYPNIPCGGRWELDDKSSRGASFTEVLTRGADLCSNYGHVTVEKINDSEISCRFSHAGRRDVVATAVLSKRKP